MARIVLNRYLQVVEAEGSEIPIVTEWQVWRVEIELARGNWDGANSTAKYVSPCLSFFFFSALDVVPIFVVFFLFDSDVLQLQSNLPDVLTLHGLVLFLCGQFPQALRHATRLASCGSGYFP
jgi:DnaJ family protein C protein 7